MTSDHRVDVILSVSGSKRNDGEKESGIDFETLARASAGPQAPAEGTEESQVDGDRTCLIYVRTQSSSV